MISPAAISANPATTVILTSASRISRSADTPPASSRATSGSSRGPAPSGVAPGTAWKYCGAVKISP